MADGLSADQQCGVGKTLPTTTERDRHYGSVSSASAATEERETGQFPNFNYGSEIVVPGLRWTCEKHVELGWSLGMEPSSSVPGQAAVQLNTR
jgi:hypothetical protein